MKTHLYILIVSVFLALNPARADIALGAPGVGNGGTPAPVVTRVPFRVELFLDVYKFVYSGFEVKGNTAGAPGSYGTRGNGGQVHYKATVSADKSAVTGTHGTPGVYRKNIKYDSQEFGARKITCRDIEDFNTAALQTVLITPVVFRADPAATEYIQIKLVWQGGGNGHKPDGIFNILGEYQYQPPAPTGSLNFAVGEWMLSTTTTVQPTGVATIIRE